MCRVRPAGQDSRFSTLQRGFESRTRCHRPEVARALTPRDANRPQRLGGSGTRHRKPCSCSVNSEARVLACPAGGRGFESRTGRQFSRRRQVVEGDGLQIRWCMPASVRSARGAGCGLPRVEGRGGAGQSDRRVPCIRALGGGRSSMAEPRVVIPLTLVRFRSATPKRTSKERHHETRHRRLPQLSRSSRPASAVAATRPKPASSAACASSTATRSCARSSAATTRASADPRVPSAAAA